MNTLATLRVLVRMALRDLAAHWVKSLIVGTLMAFGAFLVVTGGALLDSISGSMEESITSSLAGHIQVYSADAEDDLELFGGTGMGSADLGEIPAFGPVRDALMQVEQVKDIVPMGITQGTVFGRTSLDRLLEDLRVAVAAGDTVQQAALMAHVREIARGLEADVTLQEALTADAEQIRVELAALRRVQGDEFAAWLADDPDAALMYLDTDVAPLAMDGRMLYLRCIGTELDQFARVFDRFRIVHGEMVPPGRRGILLSNRFYETWAKHPVARNLDQFKDDLEDGKVIAEDATFDNRIQANAGQYNSILFQLAPDQVPALIATLKAELGAQAPASDSPVAVLEAFLTVDDDNFSARYDAFYTHIAPLINLYEIPLGGVVTLRGFTKSGYMRAVNVRVWGTYDFVGLEKSDIAGASNLVDLVTFRALYGQMTDAQRAELADIRVEAGLQDVSREEAEDALFGEGGIFGDELVARAQPDEPTEIQVVEELAVEELAVEELAVDDKVDDKIYSQDELVEGMVLNAAVILHDPDQLRPAMVAIQDAADAADLKLQVVDWQTAAGIVGQLTYVLRGVLLVAIGVIFLVTLVIINNTMVMATMDRTTEIGTMRAIGAQRGFVVVLFLLETMVLGLVAGTVGGGGAVLFIGWLGHVGIPAVQDILVLLFAGPRLYPTINAGNILTGVVVIVAISLLSTLYPSLLAAGVQPVVAMRGKD